MLKKIILGAIAILLLFIAISRYMPVGEEVDPFTYFDEFKGNTYNLVFEDKRVDLKDSIIFIDDTIYISYAFARANISDIIFYDEAEKILTITNAREVMRIKPESKKGELNGEMIAIDDPIYERNEMLYLPAPFLEKYFGVQVQVGKEQKLFIVNDTTKDAQIATTSKRTSLRTHPLKKTTVVETVKKGEKVYVYKIEDGFARVRSSSGMIGFVPEGDLKNIQLVQGVPVETVEAWPVNPLNEKVKLVWDQLGAQTVGNWETKKYTQIKDVNVISPTWYEFEDEEGNLTDKGTKGYVDEAHKRGMSVWPLLSHSFTNPGLTKTILSSTAKRQYVIDQIIERSKRYGYDGINIDIENIQTETSAVWVQFVRELYPQMKREGLIVSVDVYMPSAWSSHYEREKVASACDYFIVMAYDQHYYGSEAGSVAELPWVEEGIQKNLEEVPKEKLVLGIPFYTRLWKDTVNGLEVKSHGMNAISNLIKEWGVTPALDPNSGQLYAEKAQADGTYKVWIENSDSMAQRINLINKYDLAGYGAWKLGLETADIWDEIVKVED